LDDTPKKPKPKGWNFSKCLQWLMQNPVTDDDNVVFLCKKAKEVIQIAAAAADCQGNEDSGKLVRTSSLPLFDSLSFRRQHTQQMDPS
jgi:hypothetical protein